MVFRVEEEHEHPIESLRRIACAFVGEQAPNVWNRSDYAIVYVSWSVGGIAGFT